MDRLQSSFITSQKQDLKFEENQVGLIDSLNDSRKTFRYENQFLSLKNTVNGAVLGKFDSRKCRQNWGLAKRSISEAW